jgi:hypothetical protein
MWHTSLYLLKSACKPALEKAWFLLIWVHRGRLLACHFWIPFQHSSVGGRYHVGTRTTFFVVLILALLINPLRNAGAPHVLRPQVWNNKWETSQKKQKAVYPWRPWRKRHCILNRIEAWAWQCTQGHCGQLWTEQLGSGKCFSLSQVGSGSSDSLSKLWLLDNRPLLLWMTSWMALNMAFSFPACREEKY